MNHYEEFYVYILSVNSNLCSIKKYYVVTYSTVGFFKDEVDNMEPAKAEFMAYNYKYYNILRN